jgi:hypothetical protein
MQNVSGVYHIHVTFGSKLSKEKPCVSVMEPRKKPDGEQVYFSVVQYVINKGGRLGEEG